MPSEGDTSSLSAKCWYCSAKVYPRGISDAHLLFWQNATILCWAAYREWQARNERSIEEQHPVRKSYRNRDAKSVRFNSLFPYLLAHLFACWFIYSRITVTSNRLTAVHQCFSYAAYMATTERWQLILFLKSIALRADINFSGRKIVLRYNGTNSGSLSPLPSSSPSLLNSPSPSGSLLFHFPAPDT